jgi:exodeoxyribonuclease III
MKIITFNANGLRSAARKGFFPWLARQRADFLCVQEIKAQSPQLAGAPFAPRAFRRYIAEAARPGYSGVALYTRHEPRRVVRGFGSAEFDAEGRYLALEFPGLTVISVYFPSGSSGEHRQAAKFRFLEQFSAHLATLRGPYILCGDFNIAHRAIDLKNWRANQKNSGFLPEEREWMENVLNELGHIDAFRAVNAESDQYTWWSNRGRAWEKNVGWRIDYQIASPELAGSVRAASIYKRRRFSDHAPLSIDYDWAL